MFRTEFGGVFMICIASVVN